MAIEPVDIPVVTGIPIDEQRVAHGPEQAVAVPQLAPVAGRALHTEAITSYRAAERHGRLLINDSPLGLQLRCSTLIATVRAGTRSSVGDALDRMTDAERDTGEAREMSAVLALATGDAGATTAVLAPTLDGSAPVHHVVVVVRSLLLEAHAQAHDRGVKIVGATAHYVTADLDEGPIIEQEIARVSHSMTTEQVTALGRDTECLALARAVRWHSENRVLLDGNRTVVFT